MPLFDLQGHRGARGLKPENTLPAFEIALDLGVSSIETDVHLTHDGVPVLFHDPVISAQLCRPVHAETSPEAAAEPLIATLTLADLRGYRADRNPDLRRFPAQDNSGTAAAQAYAQTWGLDVYTVPTLAELFGFTQAYAGELGEDAGKSALQRARAQLVQFDLELKRVPFRPEAIGDQFDGETPGLLEREVVEQIRAAGVVDRARIRSFDHRCLRAVRRIAPDLPLSVLIAETLPVDAVHMALASGAQTYCPNYRFLDPSLVHLCHQAGIRVIPWTVNKSQAWETLLDWGVDGITTDFPDQLAGLLHQRRIAFRPI
jgi:glycerophosphoryl diester phosphodiesterase